jgi:hypothetical protein
VNVKSAPILLGASVGLYFLWVGCLIAMAVYSAKRPPERIIRQLPASSHADPDMLENR